MTACLIDPKGYNYGAELICPTGYKCNPTTNQCEKINNTVTTITLFSLLSEYKIYIIIGILLILFILFIKG
jgi:hypothetical protein